MSNTTSSTTSMVFVDGTAPLDDQLSTLMEDYVRATQLQISLRRRIEVLMKEREQVAKAEAEEARLQWERAQSKSRKLADSNNLLKLRMKQVEAMGETVDKENEKEPSPPRSSSPNRWTEHSYQSVPEAAPNSRPGRRRSCSTTRASISEFQNSIVKSPARPTTEPPPWNGYPFNQTISTAQITPSSSDFGSWPHTNPGVNLGYEFASPVVAKPVPQPAAEEPEPAIVYVSKKKKGGKKL